MDIFQNNFEEVYGTLKSKIETCKFWSFDLEMSGINVPEKALQNRKDDTPDIRYKKMVNVATKYSIIQFGLCLFHDDGQGGLLASPYNIYLFPNSSTSNIVLSTGAIDFLKKNKMDFQKWIGQGVTFVDAAGEAITKEKFFGEEKPTRTPVSLSKKSDIEFMERNMKALSDFLENPDEQIYTFEGCNGFLRRCIYEQVESKYPNGIIIQKGDGNKLAAFKVSKEAQAENERQQKEKKDKEFFSTVGFRHVFNDLVACRKPLVGHNLFFDLLFTLRWLDRPLPDSYQAFREHIHELFPFIYDTKYIEWCGALGVVQTDTSLDQCFQRYTKECEAGKEAPVDAVRVDVTVSEDMTEAVDLEGGNFHNAGYDAYCTGFVFAQQMAICNAIADAQTASTSPLETCTNRMFMMWSLFDLDLDPSRDCNGYSCKFPGTLVRVTGFPKKFTTQSVMDLCSSAGYSSDEDREKLQVIWVDDDSLFVSLPCECGDERVSALGAHLNEVAPGRGRLQLMHDFMLNVSDSGEAEEAPADVVSVENKGPIAGGSVWRSAVDLFLSPFRWAAYGDEEREAVQPSRKRARKD